MRGDIAELVTFVLHAAANEPVRRRIILYRALAKICGEEQEACYLTMIANDLQTAEDHFAEFIFSFSQKAPKTLRETQAAQSEIANPKS